MVSYIYCIAITRPLSERNQKLGSPVKKKGRFENRCSFIGHPLSETLLEGMEWTTRLNQGTSIGDHASHGSWCKPPSSPCCFLCRFGVAALISWLTAHAEKLRRTELLRRWLPHFTRILSTERRAPDPAGSRRCRIHRSIQLDLRVIL